MITIDTYDITLPSMRKTWKEEFHQFLIKYYEPSLVNAENVFKAVGNVDSFIKTHTTIGTKLLLTKDVDAVRDLQSLMLSHRSFAMGPTISANDFKVIVLDRYIEFLNKKEVSAFTTTTTIKQDSDEEEQKRLEGRLTEAKVLRRQRNRAARQKCLEDSGYTCYVCGFNFENAYGEIGKGFLEVHHTKPLATYDDEHVIPQSELCALCSNCHSMVHRRREVMDVVELKRIFNKNVEELK